MIEFKSIEKAFGKNEVLQGIDLRFAQTGRISAVLGPNGSGKTTLIKSLLGMVLPDQGSIEVNGQPIRREWAYRNQIDYLPQIARFPENLRVAELLRMIKDIRGGASRDEELIERFGLQPFLDKRLGTLSGGTKQKVNLTLALMYDSPIVILDEPTSGLDPVAMIQLKELIRQEKEHGKMVLITTHIMSFVEEMADEIVFLLEGKIYFRGSVAEIKTQHQAEGLEEAIAGILKSQLSATARTVAEPKSALQSIMSQLQTA
jgi:Cu-processing system ATP-binding protein